LCKKLIIAANCCMFFVSLKSAKFASKIYSVFEVELVFYSKHLFLN